MIERTVAVLAGGLSHEREVSLRSGRRVADGAARRRDVGAASGTWTPAWSSGCAADPPDAVVDRAARRRGRERLGAGGAGAARRAVRGHPGAGLPAGLGQADGQGRAGAGPGCDTPDWVALPHATFRELGAQAVLDAMVDRLGLPLMVKPDQGGSALGAHVVSDRAELPAAMVGCLAYCDTVLVEQLRRRHRGGGDGGARRRGAARAAAGGDRTGGRALRLLGPLHAGRRDLPLPGPAGRRDVRRRWRRPRWRRTSCSGCATCPAPTRSSTPPGGCRSSR